MKIDILVALVTCCELGIQRVPELTPEHGAKNNEVVRRRLGWVAVRLADVAAPARAVVL